MTPMYKRNSRLIISLIFTGAIYIYLLIRAFNTEFISDETATYWYYAYRGWFWGDQVVLDANNHPLNSFIAFHLYNYFGDVPGILRIGSLFSFLLFAFASYNFTGLLNGKRLQILGFIAIISIPYMLEYFAYLRGYGLSMGFFMCSLWHLYKYANTLKIYNLGLTYFLIFLSVSANLTLLNSELLIIGAVGLIHFNQFKSIGWQKHLGAIVGTIFLMRITWPVIAFGLKLKEAGAFYYSSLDGIWDMSGKSLSKYVFFSDNDLLMFVFIVLFILFLFILWKSFKVKGWTEFLKSWNTWITYLFFGNIVAVTLMAILLKVNYPEDRTGMYFVPLFLLLLLSLIQHIKYSEWFLLAFPISLLTHLSVHSSVFSPQERITDAFYRKVKSELKPDDIISLYKTMYANWHYQESHQDGLIHFPHISMRQGNESDVFVTRGEVQACDSVRNPWIADYEKFAYEPNSDHVAYRRKYRRKENLFFHCTTSFLEGSGEFMELLNSSNFFKNEEDVRLKFRFQLIINQVRQSTDFVVTTLDDRGQTIRYLPMAFELNFQSKKMAKQFNFSVMLDNLNKNEKGLKVYIWNRKIGVRHRLNNLKIDAFEVNNQNASNKERYLSKTS